MYVYQCVDQADLEKFDGVQGGKYTIGLGQKKMSFCDDREDIYSIALTAVSSLLRKYDIDHNSVGRLEVGTETILDKSKSVKSVLMQLFEQAGNTNIEGVDTINACYGGTNALFNAVNWIESSAWDGRNAIVVAGDIALYRKGNARPTGGAGCVAMLLGPNASLVLEPGLRGNYFKHAYDFYKPDLTSEYPIVDGQYSIRCYIEALDACYKAYNHREASVSLNKTDGEAKNTEDELAKLSTSENLPLDRFDYVCFHAPTCKLVEKSYARLLYNDYLKHKGNSNFKSVPHEIGTVDYSTSLTDKLVEKFFMGLTKEKFAKVVGPTVEVATMCGNMYCASVYGGLCSLLANVDSELLQNKRVGLFSYGSGLASSFFSVTVKDSTQEMQEKLNLHDRLAARVTVPPQVYDEVSCKQLCNVPLRRLKLTHSIQKCNLREKAHLKKDFAPCGNLADLCSGTYYLVRIDDQFRRTYDVA